MSNRIPGNTIVKLDCPVCLAKTDHWAYDNMMSRRHIAECTGCGNKKKEDMTTLDRLDKFTHAMLHGKDNTSGK